MSIMTSMTKAIATTGQWLRGKAKGLLDEGTPHAVASAPISARYLHISKPITPDVQMATQLGLHATAASLLMNQKGVTYHRPQGALKRHADKMAEAMGLNNKQRRRLRSAMRRRWEGQNENAAV